MRLPYEKAVEKGVIKSVKSIKLSNDEKKVLKEGIVFDAFDSDVYNVAAVINAINVQKVAQFEAFSNYLYAPLKRSFRSFVRIISIVFRAVRSFKIKRIQARIQSGKSNPSELNKFKNEPIKHTIFQVEQQIDNVITVGGNDYKEHVEDQRIDNVIAADENDNKEDVEHTTKVKNNHVEVIINMLNSERSSDKCFAISQNENFRAAAMAYYKLPSKS